MKSGLINLNSDARDIFGPLQGDAVEVALYNVAAKFITTAVDKLNAADRIGAGALENSIIPSDIIVSGKLMTINISLNDYYKFLDQGVRGWKTGTPNSPYAFKAPQKGGQKTSKMVTAIKAWLAQEGSKQNDKNTKHTISSREHRRAKITDTSTQQAIIATIMIKRKGLKRTLFWTSTAQSMAAYAASVFETALAIDINNSLYGNSN
jgi:hypothetical protein